MKKYRIVKGGLLWWAKKIAPPAATMALAITAIYIWAGIGIAWE